MSKVTNIIIQNINSEYSLGKYLNINVVIMNKNRYINATKFCADHKKDLFRYFETTRSKKTQKGLEDMCLINMSDQKIKISKNVSKKIIGTYVHPKLMADIASWVSFNMYFTITNLIDKYNENVAEEEKNKIIQKKNILLKKKDDALEEKDDIIDKKDDKIDELMKKLDKFEKKSDKNSKKMCKKVDKVLKINKQIKSDVKTIVKDRVIQTGESKDLNHLILIENNKEDDDFKPQYTVLRVMKSGINSAIKKHNKKYKKMKQLLDIDYNPNTIVLWKVIKNRLKKEKRVKFHEHNGHISGMSFNLKNNTTQTELIDIFKKEHKKRLNTNISSDDEISDSESDSSDSDESDSDSDSSDDE